MYNETVKQEIDLFLKEHREEMQNKKVNFIWCEELGEYLAETTDRNGRPKMIERVRDRKKAQRIRMGCAFVQTESNEELSS